MNSLIIGPGAIGALTCAQVQSASSVYVWPHRSPMTLASHLHLPSERVPLTWNLLDTAQKAAIDVIWVCCKAFHAIDAVHQALEYAPNAIVILLHNGMGPQQTLAKTYPGQIIYGSTTCGALKQDSGAFQQTSFGQTQLDRHALLNPKIPRLVFNAIQRMQQSAPLQIILTDAIEQTLWRKLVINACINPLTAYHQVQNGKLLDDPYQQEVRALAEELEMLLAAVDIQLDEPVLSLVNHVAQISRENWSSMAMDVKHHARTEIQFINGYLLEQGARYRLKLPLLEMWYQRMMSTEPQ